MPLLAAVELECLEARAFEQRPSVALRNDARARPAVRPDAAGKPRGVVDRLVARALRRRRQRLHCGLQPSERGLALCFRHVGFGRHGVALGRPRRPQRRGVGRELDAAERCAKGLITAVALQAAGGDDVAAVRVAFRVETGAELADRVAAVGVVAEEQVPAAGRRAHHHGRHRVGIEAEGPQRREAVAAVLRVYVEHGQPGIVRSA